MVSPPRYASVSVACGTHCGARHGCTAQAFEITVTLRLHPQSGRYAHSGPCCGASGQGLHLHTYHRTSAAIQGPSVSKCMQVLPIARYGHMSMTADLLARDIAALLPSDTQESSARDG